MTRLELEGVQLPAAPQGWSLDVANADRCQAIAAFGFTDRQARFLLEVLLHSGVFLERQYCQFAGIVHGQKTTNFIRDLVDRRLATPITPGKLHRGRMFHLHYKPLWSAIDEADSRFRKRAAQGRMIERVMLPIGIHPEFGDQPVFVYLVTRPSPWDFRLFLLRHVALLRVLSRWTIRLLFPKPLVKARHAYLRTVRDHLATTLDGRGEMLENVFRERLQLTDPKLGSPDQRGRLDNSVAFNGPRFNALYQQWLVDPENTIRMADSRALGVALDRGDGRIACVDLARQYLHLSPLVDVA